MRVSAESVSLTQAPRLSRQDTAVGGSVGTPSRLEARRPRPAPRCRRALRVGADAEHAEPGLVGRARGAAALGAAPLARAAVDFRPRTVTEPRVAALGQAAVGTCAQAGRYGRQRVDAHQSRGPARRCASLQIGTAGVAAPHSLRGRCTPQWRTAPSVRRDPRLPPRGSRSAVGTRARRAAATRRRPRRGRRSGTSCVRIASGLKPRRGRASLPSRSASRHRPAAAAPRRHTASASPAAAPALQLAPGQQRREDRPAQQRKDRSCGPSAIAASVAAPSSSAALSTTKPASTKRKVSRSSCSSGMPKARGGPPTCWRMRVSAASSSVPCSTAAPNRP